MKRVLILTTTLGALLAMLAMPARAEILAMINYETKPKAAFQNSWTGPTWPKQDATT